jgi:Rieske Fe-S protein
MAENSEDEQRSKKSQPARQQNERDEQKISVAGSDMPDQRNQAKQAPPLVGTPRPTSTPIGKPQSAALGGRPLATSPVSPGGARPLGTPAGSSAQSAGAPSGPMPPIIPIAKHSESKVEVSRRNFIKGLAILGGLAAVASYVPLYPYLQGSVGAQTLKDQQLVLDPDVTPTTPITPGAVGSGITFTYPYTGNPNIDSDTFVQCVLIKIPSNMTMPSSYDQYTAKDSSGNIYIAFSRVCVHLWCLWGTGIDNTDTQVGGPVLGPCPCHGSTYVPATGGSSVYPHYPPAQNQVPGQAVAGPAYLQPFPNDQLPIIKIRIASDGTFHAYGRVGQIGYCQQC